MTPPVSSNVTTRPAKRSVAYGDGVSSYLSSPVFMALHIPDDAVHHIIGGYAPPLLYKPGPQILSINAEISRWSRF